MSAQLTASAVRSSRCSLRPLSAAFGVNEYRHQMRLIQDLNRWSRGLGRWLMEARRVWFPLAVVALVLFAASLVPAPVADRIRYCGLVFQLLGILTVVSGLRNKRRLFNRPSFIEHARRWLTRRPRWGARPRVVGAGAMVSASASGSAKASVWRRANTDAPVDTRLAALEANLLTLREEQTETAQELRQSARRTDEALISERQARESAVTTLRSQLEGFGVGDLHLEMIGVFWLLFGVVLATISGEIATALRWRK